jgi:hypothetical protein
VQKRGSAQNFSTVHYDQQDRRQDYYHGKHCQADIITKFDRDQNGQSKQRGKHSIERGNLPMGAARKDQSLKQMLAMSDPDLFSPYRASKQGDDGIKQKEPNKEHRRNRQQIP